MNKFRLQVLLMTATIIGVAGFQAFWLKQTYEQEGRTLHIKTDFAFREAVEELQVSKLRFDTIPGDTSRFNMKIITDDDFVQDMNVRLNRKKDMVSTIRVVRKSMHDSLVPRQGRKGIVLSNNKTLYEKRINISDSNSVTALPNRDHLMRVLYGVDHPQDSLRLHEIRAAVSEKLWQQGTMIPFSLSRMDSTYLSPEGRMNEVTTGFSNPTTYKFHPGNVVPYLLRRISTPILFSLLLLAITLLSFILLYRNLLQQRRLTAIKNEFIGNITHELKTPIATVSVAIEAMRNFNALDDPERTREYLNISANELQRLSLLVDNVLSLSKFEKNEVEINKTAFDFRKLAQEVIGSMKLQLEKKEASLTLETSGVHFTVEADREHISSVLYNLLDNALKYSKEKPIISVRVADRGELLELKISDEGIGIEQEYQGKIFDQFFRVPRGDKHDVKGYGLGLSYVNYIVKRHHGFIQVDSEAGKGSTFTVKLPFSKKTPG